MNSLVGAEHYSLPYMAMRASIIMGQGDGAAEELLLLVSHPLAPISLCLKAMQVGCCGQLWLIPLMIPTTAGYHMLAVML